MRVFVTFSMVNLVFPPFPAILPMALDKWSPFRGFTANTQRKQLNTHQEIGHWVNFPAVESFHRKFQCRQKHNISVGAILPSVTSKLSRKSSSNLIRARASCKEKMRVLGHKPKSNKVQGTFKKHQESTAVIKLSAELSVCKMLPLKSMKADKYNKRMNMPFLILIKQWVYIK